MSRLIIPLLLLVSGCASLDDMVDGIANTPEWFQERRVEIRGDGYPQFDDIPAPINVKDVQTRLAATETVTRGDLQAFLSDPRISPASLSQADISQTALEMQSDLPRVIPDADPLLSRQDIADLRARLRPPPIQKPS